jgi:tetratricopeptide (TPR) repeat protein
LPPPSQVGIPVLLTIAAQLSYLNQQERALPFLAEARRGDPDFPPMLLASAQVLIYLGRFEEAEADLMHCLQVAPDLAPAYWQLARLRRQTPEHNHVSRLEELLRKDDSPVERTALLAYALHKELDDLGDHDRAWTALETALRAKRQALAYDPEETRQLFDRLVALPVAPAVLPAPGQAGRMPIFIVGMHRSGTTLLEQLLDGHDDVKGVGELYDFTSQMRYATDHHCRGVIDATIVERAGSVDFEAVGRGYLDKMGWRLGRERCFTDKLPSNFLNIGFICRAFPQAKILHMVRDPVETCFSNLRELFSDANPYSYDQLELADYYRQYRRLMAHWHKAWPGRILDVDYAELTRDPETVLRRVSAFCGLDFQPRMLALTERERGVATASAVQVRQGIVARERPKWAPYEAYLQPLIQALRED